MLKTLFFIFFIVRAPLIKNLEGMLFVYLKVTLSSKSDYIEIFEMHLLAHEFQSTLGAFDEQQPCSEEQGVVAR
jgi:hypothetical protein